MGERDEDSKGKAGKERHDDVIFWSPKERGSVLREMSHKNTRKISRAVKDSRIRARFEVVASERTRKCKEGRDLFYLPR